MICEKGCACYIEIEKSEEYWNCPEHGRQAIAGVWLMKDENGIEQIITARIMERK